MVINTKTEIGHMHKATDVNEGTFSLDRLAAASLIRVVFSGTWPSRPTSRTDVYVDWVGGTTQPPGMLAGDTWTPEV